MLPFSGPMGVKRDLHLQTEDVFILPSPLHEVSVGEKLIKPTQAASWDFLVHKGPVPTTGGLEVDSDLDVLLAIVPQINRDELPGILTRASREDIDAKVFTS